MSTNNWQLPPDYITAYLAACKLAATDDEAFATFRSEPHISTIIENTPQWWADKAMAAMGMTPTMVRYWYTVDLIERLIGIMRGVVVEIGGGYGGMCRVISERWELDDYIIYDLPEVTLLQKRYLKQYGVDFSPAQVSDQTYGVRLCISWCAWSELSYDLRVEYAEKVISRCDHFFICSNYNKKEDLEILSKYFTGIKEYSDELVQNVIYV